jgi:hypothetical protein
MNVAGGLKKRGTEDAFRERTLKGRAPLREQAVSAPGDLDCNHLLLTTLNPAFSTAAVIAA